MKIDQMKKLIHWAALRSDIIHRIKDMKYAVLGWQSKAYRTIFYSVIPDLNSLMVRGTLHQESR